MSDNNVGWPLFSSLPCVSVCRVPQQQNPINNKISIRTKRKKKRACIDKNLKCQWNKSERKERQCTYMCGARGLSGHLNSIHPFFFFLPIIWFIQLCLAVHTANKPAFKLMAISFQRTCITHLEFEKAVCIHFAAHRKWTHKKDVSSLYVFTAEWD